MKRFVLTIAVLTASLAPLAPVQAASGAVALEGSVRDARNDVDAFRGSRHLGERSHPFDIYKVQGKASNGALSVTVTMDDLTPRNTAVYQRDATWTTFRGHFTGMIYVNGAAKWEVSRVFAVGSDTTTGALAPYAKDSYGNLDVGNAIECTDAEQANAVNLAFDYAKDTVTYTLPLTCIGVHSGDVLRLAAIANTSEGERRFYIDDSAKTSRFKVA